MIPSPRRRVRAGLAAGALAVAVAGMGRTASPAPGQAAPAPAPRAAVAPRTLEIEHNAPACVAAGKYARLDACFRPASALARARVYFRKSGTADWFYVEMRPYAPCHRALLPRPRKDVGRIDYYISATDKTSAESRTKDTTLVVTQDGSCSAGPLAPVVDSGSVVIGSASGAAPVGFLTGGGVSPILIAGGAAVVGGGTAAVLAGGNGSEPTTTTTTTTTAATTTTTTTSTSTTTTTTAPPTPTTTTTTTLPCETPNQKPSANIISPSSGGIPQPVVVTATATDPAPGSGIREVRFSYQYCPAATGCGAENAIGTVSGPTSPYTITWTQPASCGTFPEDTFKIDARAVDNCGNVSDVAFVNVRTVGRNCFRGIAVSSQSGAWLSDLQAPGARAQVVIDGSQALFPSAGTESFTTALAAGPHRFEATLVDPGSEDRRSGRAWRFDLSSLHVTPGTLRIVAGEAAQVAADAVVFRLRGRAGERVVFVFEVAGQ